MSDMILRGLGFVATVVLIWQVLVSVFHIPNYLLPSPIEVGQSLWFNKILLLQQSLPTILETLVGLLLAALWGVAVAIAMCLWRGVRFCLLPIVILSQALPTIAIAPLLVIWLGYGLASKIAVIVLTLFFPITATFYDDLRRINPAWLDMAAVMQANRWRELRYIRFPAALPALASGLRVAAAWAPMAAVIGEWVGASQGLGFLMLNANARMDIALLFAALMVLMALALLLYFIIDRLLTMAIPWAKEG